MPSEKCAKVEIFYRRDPRRFRAAVPLVTAFLPGFLIRTQAEELNLPARFNLAHAADSFAEAHCHGRQAGLGVFGLDRVDFLSGKVDAGLHFRFGEEDVPVAERVGERASLRPALQAAMHSQDAPHQLHAKVGIATRPH